MAKRDSDDAFGPTEQFRQARPEADQARMDAARDRTERALFRAAEPVRAGRYLMLDTIASGGMGVVYRAYDPQLDRKVAVKVIHPRASYDPLARDRLTSEARALARLKHPNVVPIYDVVVVDEQVVLVMELVEGQTLDAWQKARPRTWRQVLGVYIAAGRGLAAAHALGVVHRDFKPANVIVGDDGRVRVLDFGLARMIAADARSADAAAPAVLAPAVELGERLTVTGDLVGTPLYMAPEQLTGAAVTPASDQFSFCVALYGALFGVRPFSGENAEQLLTSIENGQPAAPNPSARVPGRIKAVVVRGLAAKPGARHPSLERLLALLDREHGWRRWRVPAAAAALLAVAVGATSALGSDARAPLSDCDREIEKVAYAWDAATARTIRSALSGIRTPQARDLATHVAGALDQYRDSWIRSYRRSCEVFATDRRDQAQQCLERRKSDLGHAGRMLAEGERAFAVHGLEVVADLPPIEWCDAPTQAVRSQREAPVGDEGSMLRYVAFRRPDATAEFHGGKGREQRLADVLDQAMTAEHQVARVALTRDVWNRRRDLLGPAHLNTLLALDAHARAIRDPARAAPLVDDEGELYARFHPDLLAGRIAAEYHAAFLTAERGDASAAAARYARVAALGRGATSGPIATTARLAAGHERLARGDHHAARADFEAVIQALAASKLPAEQAVLADARLGAGLAERALGRDLRAIRQLEAAELALERISVRSEVVEHHQRLALARLELAEVLRARGDDGPRRRELAAQAAAFYREVGPVSYRWRLAGVSP